MALECKVMRKGSILCNFQRRGLFRQMQREDED